jgi:hypothetical protein
MTTTGPNKKARNERGETFLAPDVMPSEETQGRTKKGRKNGLLDSLSYYS